MQTNNQQTTNQQVKAITCEELGIDLQKVYTRRQDYDDIITFEFTVGDEIDRDETLSPVRKEKLLDEFADAFKRVLIINGCINLHTRYNQKEILKYLDYDKHSFEYDFVINHWEYLMQYTGCDYIFEYDFEETAGYIARGSWIYTC